MPRSSAERKAHREFLIGAGICPRCGTRKSTSETQTCQRCRNLAKHRNYVVKDPEARNQRIRERYAERKAAGVCTHCGGERDNSTQMCSACRDVFRRIDAAEQIRRDMRGLCKMCGKNDPEKGRKNCRPCLDKEHQRVAGRPRVRYPSKRKGTSASHKIYKQRIMEERRTFGLCPRCGKEPIAKGKKSGERCLEYMRNYNKKYYAMKQRESKGIQ